MNRLERSEGSTLVETILLVLLLIVPLIWTLGALAAIHRAALGVTTAAREAGTAAVSGSDATAASVLADEAALLALRDQEMDPRRSRVALAGLSSFQRGSRVQVRVAYPVRILSVPFLRGAVGPVIWVRASHVAQVDLYRSAP